MKVFDSNNKMDGEIDNEENRKHEPAMKSFKINESHEDKGKWRTAWFEFTQSTTMHGVSRITEETPITLRR